MRVKTQNEIISVFKLVLCTYNGQCKGGPGLCSEIWTWVMGWPHPPSIDKWEEQIKVLLAGISDFPTAYLRISSLQQLLNQSFSRYEYVS